MGTAENVELVRRGYEAFNAGDMATLSEIFAEDAVWHAAGGGVLSGTKQGRDAVLAYFGELGARSQGSFQADVQDIVGGEKHTVAIQQTHARATAKHSTRAPSLRLWSATERLLEGREYFEDTAKWDDFWA